VNEYCVLIWLLHPSRSWEAPTKDDGAAARFFVAPQIELHIGAFAHHRFTEDERLFLMDSEKTSARKPTIWLNFTALNEGLSIERRSKTSRENKMLKRLLNTLAAAILMIVPAKAADTLTPALQPAGRTPISYAQLLAETVAFENPDIRSVAIYAQQNDVASLALVAHTAPSAAPASDPAIEAVARSGAPSETGSAETGVSTVLPLHDATGAKIGVLSIAYSPGKSEQYSSRLDQSVVIRDFLRLFTPKRETLFDPYMKGYDSTDTLAQRINQILLARHPDVNVIAIHITAPGDTKNKVWGINRPNFIGRDSDEVDTDTEKTGRIVMQVIPATHRMEVHMPLMAPNGRRIGTICTVYFWRTAGEAADFYGRSLGIMEEARKLTPVNRDDLFRP
jgi:hypothetical protein